MESLSTLLFVLFSKRIYVMSFVPALSYGQEILEPPVNTAANVGDTVRLNCSANLGSGQPQEYLEWRHYLNIESGERIWYSGDSDQPVDTE